MPVEVGTAYVKIKALTENLKKDIQSGLEKGVGDVNLDKASKNFSEKFVDKASADLKQGVTHAVEDAASDPSIKKAGATVGKDLKNSLEKGLTPDGQDGFFNKFIKRVIGGSGSGSKGHKAGDSFAKDFFDGLHKGLSSIPAIPLPVLGGLIGSPLIAAAVQTLSNVVVSLVGQVGTLAQALIGAGAAAGAAFGAIAISAIPIFLAFKAASPALDAFKIHAKDIGKAWQDVGLATQTFLLPGLTRALDRTKVLIPIFKELGRSVGKTGADFADFLSGVLTGAEGLSRFNLISASAQKIFRVFAGIVVKLAHILLTVFTAALPAAEKFVGIVDEMVNHFHDAIAASDGLGTLSDRFNSLFDTAHLVFGALADIVLGLKNILDIGGTTSIPIFESFRTFAANFRAFTTSLEGKNKIAEVFNNAHQIASAFFGVVKEIFDVLFSVTISGSHDSTAGIVGGLNAVRDAIPGIADAIGGFVKRMQQPLADLAKAFGEVFKSFDQIGGLSLLIETLAKSLEFLARVLELPGITNLLAIFGTLLGVFSILNALGIVQVITFIGSAISSLTLVLAGFLVEGEAATTLVGLFATAGSGALLPFAIAVAAVVGVIAALVIGITNFNTVKDAFSTAVDVITTKFNTLVDLFKSGALTKQVQDTFSTAIDVITTKFNTLLDLLTTKVQDTLSNLFNVDTSGDLLVKGTNAASSFTQGFLDTIKPLPGELAQRATDAASGFTQGFLDVIKTLPGDITRLIGEGFGGLGDLIKQPLATINDALGNVGFDKVSGIVTNLSELFTTLGTAVDDISNLLTGELQAVITVTAGVITDIFIPAIGVIVDLLTGEAKAAIDITAGVITDIFIPAIQTLITLFNDFVQSPLADFIRSGLVAAFGILGGVIQFVSKTVEAIVKLFHGDFSGAFDAAKDAVAGLIDIAKSATDGFIGIQDAIFSFLGEVGSSILRFLKDELPGIFITGLKGLGLFFFGFLIAQFLVIKEFGPKLIKLLVNGLKALPGALVDVLVAGINASFKIFGLSITLLLRSLVEVPKLIAKIFLALGPLVLDVLKTGFVVVINFFKDLPGHIGDALSALGDFIQAVIDDIVSILTGLPGQAGAVFETLKGILFSGGDGILTFFTDLPGHIGDALGTIGDIVSSALETAIGFIASMPERIGGFLIAIGDKATEIGSAIFNGITGVITGIPETVGNIIQGVGQTMIDIVNGVLGFLHDNLSFDLPSIDVPGIPGVTDGFTLGGQHIEFPDLSIPDLIKKVAGPLIKKVGAQADGGIFDRATMGIFGEAGKEAIIPLTRPRRAIQLAQDSGLVDLLNNAGVTNTGNVDKSVHVTVSSAAGNDVEAIELAAARAGWLLNSGQEPS